MRLPPRDLDFRIIEISKGYVRFRYADKKTGTGKIMPLSTFEFIRRFLQHVLPTGFIKIRYYGFLNPCSKIPLDLAITLLEGFRSNSSFLLLNASRLKADSRAHYPLIEKIQSRSGLLEHGIEYDLSGRLNPLGYGAPRSRDYRAYCVLPVP